MYAIRNKTTGRLLKVEPDTEEYGDYGGWENTYQNYTRAIINLTDSEYNPIVFLAEKVIVYNLLKFGRLTEPYHIRLEVRKGDLEPFQVKVNVGLTNEAKGTPDKVLAGKNIIKKKGTEA
jgi:hypothetical protein